MDLALLGATWLILGIIIFGAALRARTDPRSLLVGRIAVGILYLAAGALVNLAFLVRGDDYADFAAGSSIPFVRETWTWVVVPHHVIFISVLIVFEAAVGVLVLRGGRSAEVGLLAAIAFHVALTSFGWGFCIWALPMIVALTLLLKAQRAPSVLVDDVESPAVPSIAQAATGLGRTERGHRHARQPG